MVAVSLFEAGSARGDLGCSGKLENSLAGRQSVFKFTRGSFENGMAFVRGDLRQRLECEAALMHGGMGHFETGGTDDGDTEQKNIDIDWPGALTMLGRAAATHIPFDPEDSGEQLLGHLVGLERDRTVDEPGLVGEFDGLSLVKRRDSYDFTQRFECLNGGAQVSPAITLVRPQRQIDSLTHHAQVWALPRSDSSGKRRRGTDISGVKGPEGTARLATRIIPSRQKAVLSGRRGQGPV